MDLFLCFGNRELSCTTVIFAVKCFSTFVLFVIKHSKFYNEKYVSFLTQHFYQNANDNKKTPQERVKTNRNDKKQSDIEIRKTDIDYQTLSIIINISYKGVISSSLLSQFLDIDFERTRRRSRDEAHDCSLSRRMCRASI